MRPSAVTTSASIRLSQTKPYLRSSQPLPLPSASPARPVVDTRPPVTARPCSCVAASNWPHVAPPSAMATRCSVSTVTFCMPRRSTQMPASHMAEPVTEVATAVDRERQVLLACEVHRGHDVLRARAARDQRGPAVDHAVEDLAGFVVLGVIRMDEPPTETGQFEARRGHGFLPQGPPISGSPSHSRQAQRPSGTLGGHTNICSLPCPSPAERGRHGRCPARLCRAALPFEFLVPRRREPSRRAGRGSGATRAGRARDHRPRRVLRRGALRGGGARSRTPHGVRRGADARRAPEAPERPRGSAGGASGRARGRADRALPPGARDQRRAAGGGEGRAPFERSPSSRPRPARPCSSTATRRAAPTTRGSCSPDAARARCRPRCNATARARPNGRCAS